MIKISKEDAGVAFDILKRNPFISDKQLEEESRKSGIKIELLRQVIYSIAGTFVAGGAKDMSSSSVDQKELGLGRKTELEHLVQNSPLADMMAAKVALDHLDEDPKYYSKLMDMEGKIVGESFSQKIRRILEEK